MINVNKGETLLIRDVLKSREWFANVMAVVDDVIITADDALFIERFDGEEWNASRTRRNVEKTWPGASQGNHSQPGSQFLTFSCGLSALPARHSVLPMKALFPILVVEDSPDDFHLLERAFLRNKITNPIHWTRDGEEAIEYLEGRGRYANRTEFPLPRVMIVDLKMPRLGGLELLEWIKAHPNLRLLPVLIMSSSGLPKDISQAYTLGAHSFFMKPSTFDSLKELTKTIHDYWSQCVAPSESALPEREARHLEPACQA